MAILVTAWLVTHWPYRELRSKIPVLHERPITNAFVWFAAILFPLWLALIGLTLWGTFSLWFTEPPSGNDQALAYRVHYLALVGLMTALAGLIGAPLAIHRLYTVERQTKAQEEGLITDRINKAVEGLGAEKTTSRVHRAVTYQLGGEDHAIDQWYDYPKAPEIPKDATDIELTEWETITQSAPNLEVRIGAIYALERIAQDSLRDHIQIMEIICAYIRENAEVVSLAPSEPPFTRAIPRADIQVAISVIGRRNQMQKDIERSRQFRLDLRNTDLSGADFSEADFSAAMFHQCRLEFSNFNMCELAGTQFFGALLNYANFFDANLRGTKMDHAAINRPVLTAGAMSESITLANIYGLSVAGADITAINYLGEADQRNLIFGSKDTKLHTDLNFNRNSVRIKNAKKRNLQKRGMLEEAGEVELLLKEAKFPHWVPFDRTDMAFGHEYRKFLDNLNLKGWPYQ